MVAADAHRGREQSTCAAGGVGLVQFPDGFSLGTAAPGFGLGSALPRYRGAMLWGLGGQYEFGSRFGMRLDYNNFGRLEDPNASRSDLWSLNAVVRF